MPTGGPPRQSPLSEEQLDAWHAFLRAYDHVLRMLDQDLREAHGMTISEYDVLVQLSQAHGRRMRMRDLARAILLSPSGLTRLCERLESQGLVAREASSGDLRGTDAVLTTAGAARLRKASPTHLRGIHDRFAAHVGDRRLSELTAALRRIGESP